MTARVPQPITSGDRFPRQRDHFLKVVSWRTTPTILNGPAHARQTRAEVKLEFVLSNLKGNAPGPAWAFAHVGQGGFGRPFSLLGRHFSPTIAIYGGLVGGTLLREPRRALHARIGETLENQFAEIVETQPHLMAQHCSEAGHFERAINYWLKAGQQAVSRSAMPEAEALLRKGLALLSRVADSDHRKENELDLQIALGLALSQTQGFHSEAAGEAYSRARQLCDELKRPRKLLPSLYGQWVNSFFAADLNRAEQFAAEILSLGELADDVITRVVGYRAIGGTQPLSGRLSHWVR